MPRCFEFSEPSHRYRGPMAQTAQAHNWAFGLDSVGYLISCFIHDHESWESMLLFVARLSRWKTYWRPKTLLPHGGMLGTLIEPRPINDGNAYKQLRCSFTWYRCNIISKHLKATSFLFADATLASTSCHGFQTSAVLSWYAFRTCVHGCVSKSSHQTWIYQGCFETNPHTSASLWGYHRWRRRRPVQGTCRQQSFMHIHIRYKPTWCVAWGKILS